MEKVQLVEHVTEINLLSACHQFDSSETALLRFNNYVFLSMDNQYMFIVIMFNLSAACDMIDHSIKFNQLYDRFGIPGDVLEWIH